MRLLIAVPHGGAYEMAVEVRSAVLRIKTGIHTAIFYHILLLAYPIMALLASWIFYTSAGDLRYLNCS